MIGRTELKKSRIVLFSNDNVKGLINRIIELILDISDSLCKKKKSQNRLNKGSCKFLRW